MTIPQITGALRRFWPLTLAVLALFVGIGLLASFLPTPRYRAGAIVFVAPRNLQAANFGTAALDVLMPTIVEQVGTRRFAERVKRESTRPIGDTKLSATNEPGTGVLTVTGESTDPAAAAVAANVAANQLRRDSISNAVTFSVLDPAVVPTTPATPRKRATILGCIVIGLILGVFAALGANRLRRRVTGAEAIRDEFGLTVLGEIPRERRLPLRPSTLMRNSSYDEVAEAYQLLRTNFELIAGDLRTVAVTSWDQGEGKTTVTANLGWRLALLGRRVMIVDLDLRRPSAHEPFDLDLAGGVADLASSANRGGRVRARPKRTDLPELEVLTAGRTHDDPARVIETTFPSIVEAAQDRLMLVDTPPLIVSEAALIASMVDGLVIVIDVRRRDPSELEALLQVIRLTKTKVLGVVLNQMRSDPRRRRLSDYYGRRHLPAAVDGSATVVSRSGV
ncbi:MAG TPA: hypothetical protein VHB30_15045 [Solirubrobacteraceae bacterium]|jgi:capsular exopolysaccharide synthesis family protein|nr:hypothetical protein [Solirubrobacteraceae bacterium]